MEQQKLGIEVIDGSQPAEKVFVLDGVLNADTAFRFRDVVREHEPETLVIDMSRLRSLDSSGLGVLIGLYASYERSSRPLLLAGMNDRIWELFRTCRITDVFTRYSTVADAEQVLRAAAEGVAQS